MQRAKDLLVWLAVIAAVTGVFYATSAAPEYPATARPRRGPAAASVARARVHPEGLTVVPAAPARPLDYPDVARFAAP